MDKRNLADPMAFLWPWWKAKDAGRGDHTGINTTVGNTKASPRNVHIFPALPLEIIHRILKEACEWPLRRAERQMLAAASLVCKSWLPLAQHLLYLSVTVLQYSPAYIFRSPGTFTTEALLQRSHLLGFTQSLSIHVHDISTATLPPFPEDDGPEGSRECVRIPEFFFLFAHTPQLRYVELSVDLAQTNLNIGQFGPHILGWLSSLVLPIEALDFDDWGLFHSTFVYDLVCIWPTIRALRVFTRPNELPLEKPITNLRELKLPIPSLAAAVIEWLLPPPPPNEQPNLQFLELYDISAEARAALSVHGPSVSTLTLWCQPAFEIAHLFTKLEELVIAGPLWRSPLSAFPKTLKHIRIRVPGFMSNSAVPAVARMLPMLPDLRVLSIENGLTSNEHYPDLQEACETHRVEILVNSVDSSGRRVRWTAFPDNTRSPNSLLGIEDSEKGVRCDAYQFVD
ncbi:hypothetical protein EDB84DRAFT_1561819 [Lactarius hengduanensis]|nr:hypothetical protein EDB84DRAFT_1561819 [Lactarius hengduanensis]